VKAQGLNPNYNGDVSPSIYSLVVARNWWLLLLSIVDIFNFSQMYSKNL
jgi:hypothetical protein